MASEAKWTAEPWSGPRWHDKCGAAYVDGEGVGEVCTLYNDAVTNAANAARIVSCVNALAGISDPAGFVAAAVKAMEEAVGLIEDEWSGTGEHSAGNVALRNLRHALSLAAQKEGT